MTDAGKRNYMSCVSECLEGGHIRVGISRQDRVLRNRTKTRYYHPSDNLREILNVIVGRLSVRGKVVVEPEVVGRGWIALFEEERSP